MPVAVDLLFQSFMSHTSKPRERLLRPGAKLPARPEADWHDRGLLTKPVPVAISKSVYFSNTIYFHLFVLVFLNTFSLSRP